MCESSVHIHITMSIQIARKGIKSSMNNNNNNNANDAKNGSSLAMVGKIQNNNHSNVIEEKNGSPDVMATNANNINNTNNNNNADIESPLAMACKYDDSHEIRCRYMETLDGKQMTKCYIAFSSADTYFWSIGMYMCVYSISM